MFILRALVVAVLSVSVTAYSQQVAHCSVLNRAENVTKDIEIHYVDLNPNADKTIIMVHGWPAIRASWKHQIQHFQRDYRVIAVDVRGFGNSGHPGDMEHSSTFGDLAGDLYCVLERAGVSGDVICLGHDWGSQICYEAARMRPDLVHGVIGLIVPYVSWAGPYAPIDGILPYIPRLTYQTYFRDHPDQAADELERDVRRSLRAVYADIGNPPPAKFLMSRENFLDAHSDMQEIPRSALLSSDEEDHLVEVFTKTGFRNSLQFYQHGNRYGSWKLAHKQGNFSIPCPALSILATKDPVADWPKLSKLLKSATFVPKLTEVLVESSHWPQLERPEEVNEIIERWLDGPSRMIDEL